ncbi:MAG: hypothetical protein JNK37_16520 [Verrucomicrobiales bacterium]|nr:hypothetical protein [Verrucomicrobiales bacterium]
MSDPIANRTLDLACTVGSVDNALEAIEEGADVNNGGGAPLFTAIFNHNPQIVRLLIEHGADLSNFLPPAKRAGITDIDALVEMLMTFAPPDPRAIDPQLMEETDGIYRKNGLGKPVEEGEWDSLVLFAEKLEKIGATQSHAALVELLDLLRPAWSFGTAALLASVKAEKKKIAALSERYAASPDAIGALAQAHLGHEPAPAAEPDAPIDLESDDLLVED